MRAVNGYLENGQFISHELINYPGRIQAVLVFNDETPGDDKTERLEWLAKFRAAVKDAADEEMPAFPKMRFIRELINFSDED